MSLLDLCLGPCIRRIPSTEPRLFLTFDDGPDPEATPRVLETLARHGARATFFVVVERARREKSLLREIAIAGHAIGNHSLDHRYSPFFRSRRAMREWILAAERELSDLLGERPVAFRSPAGVRTPPLHRALQELGLPLVHWSLRFFDTRREWREDEATRACRRVAPGSIVLLHDTHRGVRGERFARTLSRFLDEGARRGLRFDPIRRRDLSAMPV